MSSTSSQRSGFLTPTFMSVATAGVSGFIAAQIVGALIGLGLIAALYPDVAATADDVIVPHPHPSHTNVAPGSSP